MLPSSGSILAPGAQLLGGPKIPNSETQHCSKQPFKYKAKIESKGGQKVITWPLIVTAVYLELNKVESINHYLTAAIVYHILWHVHDKQQSFILSNSCDIFKAYTFVWCLVLLAISILTSYGQVLILLPLSLDWNAEPWETAFVSCSISHVKVDKVVPVMWFHLSLLPKLVCGPLQWSWTNSGCHDPYR